jgi:enoyl-CoA hydratase
MYTWLLKEQADNGVCVVTLNRPPVNAVNQEMYAEIRDLFRGLNDDTSVRVVILTGGGKAFCGGNDLQEFQTLSPANGTDRMRLVHEAFFSIYDCVVPVIGAINGAAIGTGIGLAANCDVLFASERATFGLPEINVGVLGGGAFGARLAGPMVMRKMFYSGVPLSAEEMALHGAVILVEPAGLMSEARAFADSVAARSPEGVRLAKQALNLTESMNLKDGYALEQSYTSRLSGSPASKEALAAVIERRPPDFTRVVEG